MDLTAYPKTLQILVSQLREAEVDDAGFDVKIRPCELERCKATCCYDGVYLSREEAEYVEGLVSRHQGELLAYGLRLPEQPIECIDDGRSYKTSIRPAEEGELADDYPAHFPKTRCVFLDSSGRCGIQMLSVALGRDPWYDKPLTCWIHPLVLLPRTKDRLRPLLTLVTPENDPQKSDGYPGFASCTHCGRPDEDGIPARDALMPELEMLSRVSGRDFVSELHAETID